MAVTDNAAICHASVETNIAEKAQGQIVTVHKIRKDVLSRDMKLNAGERTLGSAHRRLALK
jgi:hypothetical protein